MTVEAKGPASGILVEFPALSHVSSAASADG